MTHPICSLTCVQIIGELLLKFLEATLDVLGCLMGSAMDQIFYQICGRFDPGEHATSIHLEVLVIISRAWLFSRHCLCSSKVRHVSLVPGSEDGWTSCFDQYRQERGQ